MSWKVGTYNGFNIFEPSAEIIPGDQKRLNRALTENKKYVELHGAPEKPVIPITGSYLQAHAPDYIGGATLDWNKKQWIELFEEMLSIGIDTGVLQASMWNELKETYYPSKYFSAYKQWNVVPQMLEAAAETGMKIALGGYGSVVGWTSLLDDKAIKNEIERQTACLKELLQWKECFEILYFTPETAYRCQNRSAEREKWMNRLYKEYFSIVKNLAPEKKILMSPASKYPAGFENDFLDFWDVMLNEVPLDILAPQDSIGCSGCLLSEQDNMWKLWKQMTSSKGITLWAHMELFERRCFGGPAPFISAPPERVLNQNKNIAPYIEKCICFEYPFFAKSAERADALRTKLFQ